MMSEEKLLELLEKAFEAGELQAEEFERGTTSGINWEQRKTDTLNKLIENV